MSAIEKQVDGTHYNKLHIQPIQLGYLLNASPCFVKLAKYLTRDKDDELVQLAKAVHVVQLEEELVNGNNLYFHYVDGYDIKCYTDHEHIEDTADLLRKFANQFEHSDLIYEAMYEFTIGHYQESIKVTKQLSELFE